MKKIINAKKYNTETAHLLHKKFTVDYLRDKSINQEDYFVSLYIKDNEEMFLHTSWTDINVNEKSSCGIGEDIIPITYLEATQWGENNMDVDKYESIFGEVSE